MRCKRFLQTIWNDVLRTLVFSAWICVVFPASHMIPFLIIVQQFYVKPAADMSCI
jgi:hypothetical protein